MAARDASTGEGRSPRLPSDHELTGPARHRRHLGWRRAGGAVVALALLLAACGGDDEASSDGSSPAASESDGGGEGTETTGAAEPEGPPATWAPADSSLVEACSFVRGAAPGGLVDFVPPELVAEVQAYEAATFDDVDGNTPPLSAELDAFVADACAVYDSEGQPESPVFRYVTYEEDGAAVLVTYQGECPDGSSPTEVTSTNVSGSDEGDGVIVLTIEPEGFSAAGGDLADRIQAEFRLAGYTSSLTGEC